MKVRTTFTKKDRSAWDRVTALRDSYRCKGRIRAEGKKAKPPVCFRPKAEGKGYGKTTVLELHSRVTGKQIGWFGDIEKPLVKTRAEAKVWDYLNGSFAPGEFRRFLADTQRKVTGWSQPVREGLKRAKEGLKAMEREARKS